MGLIGRRRFFLGEGRRRPTGRPRARRRAQWEAEAYIDRVEGAADAPARAPAAASRTQLMPAASQPHHPPTFARTARNAFLLEPGKTNAHADPLSPAFINSQVFNQSEHLENWSFFLHKNLILYY